MPQDDTIHGIYWQNFDGVGTLLEILGKALRYPGVLYSKANKT